MQARPGPSLLAAAAATAATAAQAFALFVLLSLCLPKPTLWPSGFSGLAAGGVEGGGVRERERESVCVCV